MKKTILAALSVSSLALQPVLAQDPAKLFGDKACAACHSMETKVVGPAIKDVAAKYADQEGAAEELVESIKNGSEGEWGAIPMPPNNVTDEEAKALAEWVLEQG